MTIEEAGEIVLGGEVWLRCPSCDGRGRHIADHDNELWDDCMECETKGFFLCALAEQAYELLGMKIPDKPRSSKEFFDLVQDKMVNHVLNPNMVENLARIFSIPKVGDGT